MDNYSDKQKSPISELRGYMAIIIPENKEVTTWQGVHLFHHGMSSCSQRVRIMLEEKGIPWTSHHLDIAKDEHTTPWYQGINPNAVVPTLIHDGKVIIESTDILEYIDTHFEGNSLLHQPDIDNELVNECLETANNAQKDLKVLSFEYLFKPGIRRSEKSLKVLSENLRNKELLTFHQQFSSKDGLSREKIKKSVCNTHAYFARIDEILENQTWLAGEHFSIADITWIPNVHRMRLMNFPLKEYPNLYAWNQRVCARNSYKNALVAHEPAALRGFFKVYSYFRARLFNKTAFDRLQCA